MENVTYLSSGALNRAHFALVTRQEQGGRNEDEAVWETFSAIKARMTRPSGAGIAASIGGFLNAAGLHLQLPASGWNSVIGCRNGNTYGLTSPCRNRPVKISCFFCTVGSPWKEARANCR